MGSADTSRSRVPRTLVVADKFPPMLGGIQQYVSNVTQRLPAQDIVVCAPSMPGDRAYDATLPYPVVRIPGLWQYWVTPPAITRRLAEVARAEKCEAAWFGTAGPLGTVAGHLRAAGVGHIVASTHGHEIGWSHLPGGRMMMRRIGAGVDVLTYLGPFTRPRLARLVGDSLPLVRLPGGVDPARFRPGTGGDRVRDDFGLSGRPVVVSVSRLVRRKGQDALISAWPQVLRRSPDAALLIVGSGDRERLERMVAARGLGRSVLFAGSVSSQDLPAHYDAGDVFAMPCRSRFAGLEIEGLGITNLEAAASALPVITGACGGAPDAVVPGRTGHVVDGRDTTALTDAVVDLLTDLDRARAWGADGRSWVSQRWNWDALSARMAGLLAGEIPGDDRDELPRLNEGHGRRTAAAGGTTAAAPIGTTAAGTLP